jgi:hypothetical protein
MKRARKRVRIQTYVEPEVAAQISRRGATMGTSESGVLRSSLLESLEEPNDKMLLLRRLDRLGRGVERLHRDVEFLSEAFGVFVQAWFTQTPPLPVERERAARASGESRYRQYMDVVVQRFAGGARFLDDLPKEPLADDEELDRLAGRTAPIVRKAGQ